MSIRILNLATAAATTLEGSIVRRQVRLVKVRKATHQNKARFSHASHRFHPLFRDRSGLHSSFRLRGEQHIQSDKRQHHHLGCQETSMAQPEHNTRQSNRREL